MSGVDIINNAWVVGIIGGIPSGLFVFWLTNFNVKRKQKREYLQALAAANSDMLYCIRPLIVEEKLPTKEAFNSARIATARKYAVDVNDMFDEKKLADALVKEILENPFLTPENKLKYCELTGQLAKLNEINPLDLLIQFNSDGEKKSVDRFDLSFRAGITAFMIMFIIIGFLYDNKDANSLNSIYREKHLSPIFLIPSIMIPGVLLFLLPYISKKYFNQRNRRNTNTPDRFEE